MNYKSEKINALLAEYQKLEEKKVKLEKKLSEAGLEAGEVIYIGDYGNGKTLLLHDDHDYGRERGDWLASSETC